MKRLAIVGLVLLLCTGLAEDGDGTAAATQAETTTDAQDQNPVENRKEEAEEDVEEEVEFAVHPVFAPGSMGQKGLNNAFLSAVKDNDLDGLRFHIASGAETRWTDDHGSSALHLAAERGFIRIARELIKRDPELVHAQNHDLARPIHAAALHGQVTLVQILLDNGAEVNVHDIFGATPLHNAAFHDDSLLGRFVLSRGANPMGVDKHNGTALHIAGYAGNKVMSTILVTEGVPVNAVDADGETALHVASYYGHGHTVREMLMLGADSDIKDKKGRIAKDLWCQCKKHPTLVCEKSCLPGYEARDDEGQKDERQ